MRLTDELKDARRKIETAMYEQSQRDDARASAAGARYGLDQPKITHTGDSGAPARVRQ
jgi:hypothetical protein